jgi:carboxyl-terminal processing protease
MKYKYIAPRYILLLPIIAVLLLGACREEEEPIVEEEVEEVSRNASINNWIQEEMDIYYLWLDNMRNAGSKEQEPEDYFEKLLFRPTDRFSAIFQSATELTDGLGGTSTEAGYEFGLFTTATPGQVIAEVTYIKRGSPAQNKDIELS